MIDNDDGRYLFHGTGIYCLSSIVRENRLDEGAHWGKPGEPRGPRLTKSYDVAKDFIPYNAYYAEGGVLVFDRRLLEADYRLTDYEDKRYDGGTFGDEQEVVALAPAIDDLDRYLAAIMFDPWFVQEAATAEFIELAWSEGGCPYSCDEEGAARIRYDLAHLAAHPLLNRLGDADDLPRLGNMAMPLSASNLAMAGP